MGLGEHRLRLEIEQSERIWVKVKEYLDHPNIILRKQGERLAAQLERKRRRCSCCA
jgi:hypothetical protein